MKLLLGDIIRFLTDRLFIAFVFMCFLFYVLAATLFDLQIVRGEEYQFNIRETFERSIVLKAPRGSVYDRLGRPLAVNETAFMLMLDPSVRGSDLNWVILNAMELLERNGEVYIDNFPITRTEPFEFDFTGTGWREARWKRDMNIPDEDMGAPEVFKHLRGFFGVPEDMSNEDARKILSVRTSMFLLRFRQFNFITIALNIKPETVAAISEEDIKYRGFSVDVSSTRHYPGEHYVSHIIGYIGRINNEELARREGEGYSMTDLIGKTGIELSFERELRGQDGTMTVEVDQLGRRLTTLDVTQPVPGDKLFLAFDLDFQRQVYDILYNQLKEILIGRFTATSERDRPITTIQLLNGIVMTNSISVRRIMQADETAHSSIIKNYVLRVYPQADISTNDGVEDIKQVITSGIARGEIPAATVLLVMHEQGLITGNEVFLAQLISGHTRPHAAILQKIREDEITPQMVGLDPHSGSVVVTDVNTGAVLASVNYPTYDNNQFVNVLNVEYFQRVNNDPTSPIINRAFVERRAPGSTFKMITAVAGLETGAITPSSVIVDGVSFRRAGAPFLRCWSSVGHGGINIVQAIAYSCNYFFCETSFRMGNTRAGTKEEGIQALNDYMVAFGLNERTGVEIGEAYDRRPDVSNISSPEYKEFMEKSRNPNAPRSWYEWYDGDTVATSIGQSYNNYTAASMAKFIATLASSGIRYQMTLLDRRADFAGAIIEQREPVVEYIMEVNPNTWENVFIGMYRVTTIGTGRSAFTGFPMQIAAKTGTAEEDKRRNDHTSFGGFAPYTNPQIAVYVSIPFGNTSVVPYAATRIGRDVISAFFRFDAEPERPANKNMLVM